MHFIISKKCEMILHNHKQITINISQVTTERPVMSLVVLVVLVAAYIAKHSCHFINNKKPYYTY